MTIYKIIVEDRNYTSWTIYESTHLKSVELDLNPIEHKLFSNDFFTFNKNKVEIVHSSVKSGSFIPGVLIIHGNKTYGRKNGKLLYKCVPDDKRLPPFLISYEMKQMGFSKVFTNLYVTFHFIEWTDKHPIGGLDQVIGPVDVLNHFYEYQLYCKSLHASIQKFQKETSKALKNKPHDAFIENIRMKFPEIQDRTNQKDWYIFSIDPEKSADFDDAFSIRNLDQETDLLSIYISNVTIWMDVLNLWDSFSKRISTIYLPDQKRPMLPTILSDCLCSLQSKNTRIALVLDLTIQNGSIVETKYSNCMVRLAKNFVYEEPLLLGNDHYQNLFQVTKDLSKKYKYISHIRDSHDVVSYLMILMNYHCAKEMIGFKNGIFRSNILKQEITVPETLPEEVSKFLKIIKSSSGQYIDGSKLNNPFHHELLELDAYIHITSPIRRLVDLLNILQFQENMGIINLSVQSKIFYDKWLQDLDYINTTMRSIRKVQVDCSMLDLCTNSPETLEKEYYGYLFDKLERQDGLYQYSVFLPELKLSSRITLRENFTNYEEKKFRLYLFQDEENFKKKIRLQLIN
jgi:exoribonuclease R